MATTEAATRELPRYKSHKEVWALKIAEIDATDENGEIWFRPEEHGYEPIRLDVAYMKKHEPKPGGYYVVYEDGYKSFSPAKAFEEGYTRADEQR